MEKSQIFRAIVIGSDLHCNFQQTISFQQLLP